MINKYQESKIYIIKSNQTDKIYIGSTIQSLNKRFSDHKSSRNKTTSKNIMIFGDAYIELLEQYPCNSATELFRKEGEYILLNKENAVNKCVAGRTPKEYIIDNADKIRGYKEYHKVFYKVNPDKIREYKEIYKENHKACYKVNHDKIREYNEIYKANNQAKKLAL